MSNYTVTTNFGAKDSLPSGNAGKVIKGSEFTTEFTNIQTAIATKADTAGDTFTGAVTFDAAVTLNADVTFDTNTLFVDVSANRVGIGNVAPATALDVTGTVTASSLAVDTDTLFVDANNDRVGIGTTTPQSSLDVRGSNIKLTGANPLFYLIDSTNTNTCSLQNTDGNLKFSADSNSEFSNSRHTFFIDGTERMRIDTSGNVGIGTTNPLADLHVSNGTNSDSTPVEFMIGGTANSVRTGSIVKGTTSGAYDLTLQTSNHATANQPLIIKLSDATEAMRIDASGNVGIGTTNPAESLHTAGNIRLGDTSPAELYTNSNELRLGVDKNNDNVTSNITFYTNNDEKIRIDKDGNVGIGTTSPEKKLHVKDGDVRIESDFPRLYFKDIGQNSDYSIINNNGKFSIYDDTNTTYRMAIDSSGNVGIGTSSPDSILHAQKANAGADTAIMLENSGQSGTSTASLVFTGNGGAGQEKARIKSAVYGDGYMAFHTNDDTEKMRIDSSGDLMVGTTDENAYNGGFSVKTGTVPYINVGHASSVTSGNYYAAFRHGTNTLGTITQNGTTGVLYNTSSDERLKENIADSADAGSKVDAIQIRQFDWIADGSHQDYGVIAQELVTVAPEAVHQPEDSEVMMGVDYSKLVPMLIKEVQSLRSRVAELENA